MILPLPTEILHELCEIFGNKARAFEMFVVIGKRQKNIVFPLFSFEHASQSPLPRVVQTATDTLSTRKLKFLSKVYMSVHYSCGRAERLNVLLEAVRNRSGVNVQAITIAMHKDKLLFSALC